METNAKPVADPVSYIKSKRVQRGFYSIPTEPNLPYVLKVGCDKDYFLDAMREYRPWLNENVGSPYRDWAVEVIASESGDYTAFTFKDESHAMAFKIMFADDLKLH